MAGKIGRHSSSAVILLLALMAGTSWAGGIPLAGYWDTRISSTEGGTLTLIALDTEPYVSLELAIDGQGVGAYLRDTGTNGDVTAGDGLYTFQVPIGPAGQVMVPLEILVHSVSNTEHSWPYLTVADHFPPTATPTPSPTSTPTDTPFYTATPTPTRTQVPLECQPLSVEKCLLPFPSSYFLVPDANTVTGFRVNLPDLLPGDNHPDRVNIHDGFSPANAMIGEFYGTIDPAQIPNFNDVQVSLAQDSRFLVFNADPNSPDFGHRHAVHIEQYTKDATSVLVLRPAEILEPNTRYIVAFRNLLNPLGNRTHASPVFDDLRDGVTGKPELDPLRPLYDEIFAFLYEQGVNRDDLTLAWDFRTASDQDLTGRMQYMIDYALQNFDPVTAPWRVVNKDSSNNRLFYRCSLTGPTFITSAKTFELGTDTMPLPNGEAPFTFTIYVPPSVLRDGVPVPVAWFGHGIFGNSDQVKNGHFDSLSFIGISVDLQGFTSADIIDLGTQILPRPVSGLPVLTDRLMQSLVNATLVSRLVPQIAAFLEQEVGMPILDPSRSYCIGESLGGILAAVLMAVHPDYEVGALMVPGGAWSHLLQKSAIYTQGFGPISFKGVVDALYPDLREQQLLIALLQNVWDPVDSINFTRHWSKEPLGNHGPRHILIQEGVPDPTIPNFSTAMILRPSGLPLLTPFATRMVRVPVAETPTNGAHYGGLFQYPGQGHAAGQTRDALLQKKAYFYSFFDTNGTYGPPGNIQ